MIPTSDAWRFVAPLDETNYWEDTITQHAITEHRAVRRAFRELLCRDQIVMEEIVSQARLSADCNPSALPRTFGLEALDGATTLVFEYIEGRTLEDVINHETYKKPLNWCRGGIRLVKELAEMRRARACFERIDATHFVVTDSDELRIRFRSPIGNPSEEMLAKSPLLNRLHLLPKTGVYTATETVDPVGERKLVATLLLQMVACSTKMDFDGWMGRTPRPEYGHEGSLSALILQVGNGDIDSLDQVVVELKKIHDAEASRYQKEKQAQAAAVAPPPPKASPAPSAPSALANIANATATAPSSTTAARKPSAPAPSLSEDDNPWAPPPTAVGGDPAPRTWGVTNAPPDEGNPYAPAPVSGASSPAVPVSAVTPSALATPIKKTGGLPILLIGGIAAGLVVLGVGVYLVVDMISTSSKTPNTPPVAAIAAPASTSVKAEERVRLDARGSSDADQQRLTYKWEVLSPATTSVIWTNPSDRVGKDTRLFLTSEPEVVAQFMVPGTVTVALSVNDGAAWSESIQLTFEVKPAF